MTAPPSCAPSGLATARAETASITSPTGSCSSWWLGSSTRMPAHRAMVPARRAPGAHPYQRREAVSYRGSIDFEGHAAMHAPQPHARSALNIAGADRMSNPMVSYISGAPRGLHPCRRERRRAGSNNGPSGPRTRSSISTILSRSLGKSALPRPEVRSSRLISPAQIARSASVTESNVSSTDSSPADPLDPAAGGAEVAAQRDVERLFVRHPRPSSSWRGTRCAPTGSARTPPCSRSCGYAIPRAVGALHREPTPAGAPPSFLPFDFMSSIANLQNGEDVHAMIDRSNGSGSGR